MNRIVICCALVVAVAAPTLTQSKEQQANQSKVGSNSKVEQEILAMEKELVKAGLRGDAVATDRLMADDYFFMTRDGAVHENLKAALLVMMKSGQSKGDLLASLSFGESDDPQPTVTDDAQVHVYGDTGVVIVRSTYKIRSKAGRIVEVPTRFMHVWVRRQEKWQLVAGSSTRIERSKP